MPAAKVEYRGLSPSQFFWRNREIAGFSNPARALYQTVRELVENSLDATETYGILPEIKLSITLDENDPTKVTVRAEDNGIGIPAEEVPNVFARVFYGSKYVLRQARGVFGLGIKMVVLYSQITTGKPIYVKSATPDSPAVYEYELMIDIEKNIPIIYDSKVTKKSAKWHGTVVELTVEGNWSAARRKIVEYIKRTALIAPYATIVFKSPDHELVFERVTRVMPPPPQTGRPHPRGVDIQMLKSLRDQANTGLSLEEFLMDFFESVGKRTAEKFCKWAGLKPTLKVKNLKMEDLEYLARKMKEFSGWRRPKPFTLSPLGEELLRKGVKEILKPEYVAVISRNPSSYGGNPFIVEVALAYGGAIPLSNSILLFRFANRIPLLYDESVDVASKVLNSIDWSIYKVKFPAPLAIIVHVCSTKLPFKGVGKEAIADIPEIEKEIEIAVRELARRLRKYLSKVERMYELKRREVTIGRYVDEVARALAYIVNKDGEEIRNKLLLMLKRDIERRGVSVEKVKVYASVKR